MRQLGVIVALVLTLGLMIFVAIPRLPGYQLQTFPVSGSVDVTGETSSRQIFNPGYVNRGDQGSGNEDEDDANNNSSPETGPGRVSPDFYYGFNRRINQNLRGELEPQVLMRVRSQRAGFWRVMALTDTQARGGKRLAQIIWSIWIVLACPIVFLPFPLQPIGPTEEVVQTYTMVQDFQNLVPVLYAPESVYFPAEDLAMDPEGALRPSGLLPEGLTYTVVSRVPLRDPKRLNHSLTNYSASLREHYLQVPDDIRDLIRTETERWLATSETSLTTPYEKATFLAKVLRDNYTVETDLPYFEEGEDLVSAFLFTYQGGTRDQFATTLTIMLRSIDIPARLATGFGPGQFNPFTGFYIVRNTDAYAQTEVYFPGQGWFYFNPIPNSLAFSPEADDAANPFSVLRQLWRMLAGALPAPVVQLLQKGFQLLVVAISTALRFIARLGGQGWLSLLWGAVGLTGAGFLGWLSWQGWQRWQHRHRLNQLAPVERIYQQMLGLLAQQGFGKQPSQTPLEYATGLQQRNDFRQGHLVNQMIQRYVGWRYGGEAVDEDSLQTQLSELRRNRR